MESQSNCITKSNGNKDYGFERLRGKEFHNEYGR